MTTIRIPCRTRRSRAPSSSPAEARVAAIGCIARAYRTPPLCSATIQGVWCIPGSPYANTRGVLDAIRFARTVGVPFLGTCAGFQHALIEYAEAEWGLPSDAPEPIIAPLACVLDQDPADIHLQPGSRLASIYGCDVATEVYHCSYGLNAEQSWRLTQGDLIVAARSDREEVRAVELRSHPFYFATLYQPERSALHGSAHPLIRAFLRACGVSA